MFSSGPNYNKLKTNLRLAVSRLKLLEKKKTELAQKARKEIADYIAADKVERAKIRVEHIIREDYLVEAMEIVECYCDLLLARMGLIQQMKTLDEGLAEPIASILWVTPRLQADIAELQVIASQLGTKYGQEYVQACRENSIGAVSPKLMHKLSVQAPPKILVERYLCEIARNYNVAYGPDPQVMAEDEMHATGENLINFGGTEDSGAGGGPKSSEKPLNTNFNYPTPAPRSKVDNALNLPDVPAEFNTFGPPASGTNSAPTGNPDEEANFDDLTKRFEALKKRK
ncbi:IST1 homolog [Pollicipes pollicipes]|uniref:IST1 homolog n=1 Tax=Pollicipes pollicipes TaxID=41117 RepID=UPI00188579B6|nr:IST1 homolog [Pollicipes pollicipes]